MVDILNEVEPQNLLNKITLYRRLNFRKVSDELIIERLRGIVLVDIKIRYNYENLNLYRARKNINNSLFIDESDIWSPPSHLVKATGRLNSVGEPVLYTTMNIVTLAREINLVDGDWFTLIKYSIKPGCKLRLVGIGMGEDEHDDLSQSNASGIVRRGLTDKGILNLTIINDFIRTEFSREVGIGTEHLYRTSLLIAKNFFALDSEKYDGYIYFSIASKVGYNVALPPHVANNILQFEGLKVFKYYKEEDTISGRFYSISKGQWSNNLENSKIIYGTGEPGPVRFDGMEEYKEIVAEWQKHEVGKRIR